MHRGPHRLWSPQWPSPAHAAWPTLHTLCGSPLSSRASLDQPPRCAPLAHLHAPLLPQHASNPGSLACGTWAWIAKRILLKRARAQTWLPEVETETAVSPWAEPEVSGAGAAALPALGAAAGLPDAGRPGAGAVAPSRLLLVLPVGAGAVLGPWERYADEDGPDAGALDEPLEGVSELVDARKKHGQNRASRIEFVPVAVVLGRLARCWRASTRYSRNQGQRPICQVTPASRARAQPAEQGRCKARQTRNGPLQGSHSKATMAGPLLGSSNGHSSLTEAS